MAGRFSVESVFKAIDKVTAPVKRMQNRVGKFTRGATAGFRKIDRATTKMVSGMRRYGAAAAASLALVSGAMAQTIGVGMDFEQTMVNAAVKFPGEIRKGTEAYNELQAAAQAVGATTEFTASQAASGLNYLAMAGFNAEQSMASLPGLVDLATAAQVDLGQASDIATDSLGAFNLTTKDAAQLQQNLARVSDVLALTTVRANTSMEDMFEAIKDGAPVATAAGASLETVSAMIGTMANAGIKGTRAGTALKNIFLAISAPGSAAGKVFQRLGVQTVDANGKVRDAIAVFQDFLAATGKLTDAQRMEAFKTIFGKIPIAAAINLTNSAEAMGKFRTELEGAAGTTGRMAAEMRDTNLGRWKTLLSTIESIQIAIFAQDAGPLADALDRVTANLREWGPVIADKVGNGLAWVLNNLESIGDTLVTVGKGVATFLAFAAAVKVFSAAMTVANLVMAANPIGLIILAVVALGAALTAAVIWWDDIGAAVKRFAAVLPGPIRAVVDAAATLVENWGPLKAFFSDLWATIVGTYEGSVERVTAAFHWMAAAPAAVMQAWGQLRVFFSDLWVEVVQTFEDAVARVIELFAPVAEMAGRLTDFGGAVADKATALGGGVASFFGFGDEPDESSPSAEVPAPVVASPQARVARQIDEQRTTSSAEVTIRDETQRAEVTRGKLGAGIELQPTGAF